MTERYLPANLTLMELMAVNWVLSLIRKDVLRGKPSGQAIDQALGEIMGYGDPAES